MKIALLGYGKMGKTIAELAKERGHEIVLTTNNTSQIEDFKGAEVAIDFSVPQAAYNNITKALRQGIPVISGTTGWLEQYNAVVDYCHEYKGAFLYASNFSIGVNLFFALNKTLAKLMRSRQEYNPSITEVHHTQKLDAPSGTAISLAQDIIKNSQKEQWSLQNTNAKDLWIEAIREGDVKGTHHVTYESEVDSITISHKANSRAGFAMGAIIAAEWIKDKQGVFTMNNVLNIS